jgi:hypothetical protein
MDYLYLAVIVFGICGIIVMSISGALTMNKENNLKSQAEARGYEYGIYYELLNGENAFCFIHKDFNKAEKCLYQMRKQENFTQVMDWQGKVYCFTVESFEKAVGEKIDRKKFKIINRSLKFNENKNLPKLNLSRGFSPSLIFNEMR